jgi:hypothetical protein
MREGAATLVSCVWAGDDRDMLAADSLFWELSRSIGAHE